MCQFSFISTATELHQRNASKLWACLIPTPANLLIYMESGYNLKVRGSNPLPATNLFITTLLMKKIAFVIRFSVLFPLSFVAGCLAQNILLVAYNGLVSYSQKPLFHVD